MRLRVRLALVAQLVVVIAVSVTPSSFGQIADKAPTLMDLDGGVACEVAGRVVTRDGSPIAGAEVWFLPDQHMRQALGLRASYGLPVTGAVEDLRRRLPTVQSDEEGHFALVGRVGVVRDPNLSFYPQHAFPTVVVQHAGHATRAIVCSGLFGGGLDLGEVYLEPEAVLVGRILDEDGLGIEQVRISPAQQGFSPLFSTRSDDRISQEIVRTFSRSETAKDGRFELRGLWNGSVGLFAERNGYLAEWIEGIVVPAGQVVDVGEIRLSRGAAVAGRVVDDDGSPVSGASVAVDIPSHDEENREFEWGPDKLHLRLHRAVEHGPWGRTDASGQFRITGIPEGACRVYGVADGYEPAGIEDVDAGEDGLLLTLRPQSTLQLTIVDAETGSPVEAATVVALRRSGPMAPYPFDEASQLVVHSGLDARQASETDGPADGFRLVERIGPSGTVLIVGGADYATEVVDLPGAEPGTVVKRTIQLKREAVVRGRVVSRNGKPIPDLLLHLRSEDQSKFHLLMEDGSTDSDGRFVFDGLAGGDWWIAVGTDKYLMDWPYQGRQDFTTQAGAVSDLPDLVLNRRCTVTGRATWKDGRPLAGVRLYAIGQSEWARSGARAWFDGERPVSITDAEGRFEFGTLVPGSWVVADGNDEKAEMLGSFSVAEGEQRTVKLAKASPLTVRGQVLSDGEPVLNAMVAAFSRVSLGWLGMTVKDVRITTTSVDDRGRFELKPAAESFSLVAFRHDPPYGATTPITLTLKEGEATSVDLEFAGRTVVGVVRSAETGLPVSSARVKPLLGLGRDPWAEPGQEWWPVTDDEGAFRLFVPSAGGEFVIEHDTFGSRVIQLQTADVTKPLDVELETTGNLRVAVRSRSGASLPPGPYVSIIGDPVADLIVSGIYGNDGIATFDNLQPGSYRVVITSTGLWFDDESGADVLVEQHAVVMSGELTEVALWIP